MEVLTNQHTEDSFGGLVNDLLGSLNAVETGEEFTGSLDPLGNRFQGKSVPEMIERINDLPVEKLRAIDQRLDDQYGVEPGQPRPENISPVYTQAKEALGQLIQKANTPQAQR